MPRRHGNRIKFLGYIRTQGNESWRMNAGDDLDGIIIAEKNAQAIKKVVGGKIRPEYQR